MPYSLGDYVNAKTLYVHFDFCIQVPENIAVLWLEALNLAEPEAKNGCIISLQDTPGQPQKAAYALTKTENASWMLYFRYGDMNQAIVMGFISVEIPEVVALEWSKMGRVDPNSKPGGRIWVYIDDDEEMEENFLLLPGNFGTENYYLCYQFR